VKILGEWLEIRYRQLGGNMNERKIAARRSMEYIEGTQ